jgi:hypothetical protein
MLGSTRSAPLRKLFLHSLFSANGHTSGGVVRLSAGVWFMIADVHRQRHLTPRQTFASNVAPSCRLVSPHTWADSNRLPRLQCRDKHGSASFTCAGSAATRNASTLGWKGAFSTFISYLRWTTLQQNLPRLQGRCSPLKE